jgi:hypothetical protein
MADYHQLIRDAIGATVVALFPAETFPALKKVYVLEQFDPRTSVLPCISVTYEAGSERITGGTNERDYVAYPVLVALHGFGPINQPSARPFPSLTDFRNTMRAAFNNQRLPAVSEVFVCEYQGQPMIDLAQPQYEKLNTAVAIIATAAVPRGA